MSLKDKRIKSEYRSLIDNVVQDFYIPLLHESTSYKRAVGFFSSSALVEISKGIADMAKDGGKIEIVASPYLSDDDIQAIKEGYENRQKIIEGALIRQLSDEHEDYLELMPPDIEMDCKRMIEKNKKIKESKNSMIININSGQINISQGNSKLNATQNNGTSGDELEKIIEEIRESLHNLNKEDAEKISDVIELAQQELVKSKPKVSRLRNCLTMFAPMFTIANGIPTLTDNLHKLQEIIMSYIK